MTVSANSVCRRVIPGYLCTKRYTAGAGAVHPLDKHFGIDGYHRTQSGMMWTFQEKFRQFDARRSAMGLPPYRDFTLEYMNDPRKADAYGEHFHLAAQWYFYAWANRHGNGFDAWFLMNVPLFCGLCADFGGAIGLSRALHGENKQNKPQNSRASFLTFPAVGLRSCFYQSEGVIPDEVADLDEADSFESAFQQAADGNDYQEDDYESRFNPWGDDE